MLISMAASLHRKAVRARRPSGEGGVEIELESAIFCERVVRHLDHPDAVIALEVDDAGVVLIQEIVGDYEAAVVAREEKIVRSRVLAETHYRELLQIRAVSGIQQSDLPGL